MKQNFRVCNKRDISLIAQILFVYLFALLKILYFLHFIFLKTCTYFIRKWMHMSSTHNGQLQINQIAEIIIHELTDGLIVPIYEI